MKYYVVSDWHSHLNIVLSELEKAGFFRDPDPHKLIALGDVHDRGKQAIETDRFLINEMEKDELIFIRGNHEDLFEELVLIDYGQPYWYHVQNGTYSTALMLSNYTSERADNDLKGFVEACKASDFYKKILPTALDFFETEKYVFVHGWIPCEYDYENDKWQYCEDWRDADVYRWREARAVNGIDASRTCREPGKTIVCGHWHASYGHYKYEQKGSEWGETADFSPFYSEGIIAIDACTAYSGKANVIVLEDG